MAVSIAMIIDRPHPVVAAATGFKAAVPVSWARREFGEESLFFAW
jgi:hypothetical protein